MKEIPVPLSCLTFISATPTNISLLRGLEPNYQVKSRLKSGKNDPNPFTKGKSLQHLAYVISHF